MNRIILNNLIKINNIYFSKSVEPLFLFNKNNIFNNSYKLFSTDDSLLSKKQSQELRSLRKNTNQDNFIRIDSLDRITINNIYQNLKEDEKFKDLTFQEFVFHNWCNGKEYYRKINRNNKIKLDEKNK